MRVLLVAAKRHLSSTSTSASSKARASSPPFVDVDSFALGNAYELSGMINPQAIAAGKLVALVDIGASKTNINIMSDSVSYFTASSTRAETTSPTPSPRSSPSRSRKPRRLKRGVTGSAYSGAAEADPPRAAIPAAQHAIVMLSNEDADKSARRRAAGAKPPGCGRRAAEGAAAGMPTASWTAFRASWRTSATTSTFRSITSRTSTTRRWKRSTSPGRFEHDRAPGDPGTDRSKAGQPLESPAVLRPELPRDSQQELQDNPTQAAIALGLASRIVE